MQKEDFNQIENFKEKGEELLLVNKNHHFLLNNKNFEIKENNDLKDNLQEEEE